MMIPQGCFAFDVYENDIRTDLFDVTPRDNVFAGIPPEAEEFSGTGYDDFLKATGTEIEFHISYIAQSGTVPAVDYFLLSQIVKSHEKSPQNDSYFIICGGTEMIDVKV